MAFHILVVEDDPPIAAGIVRGLKAEGFDVELANTGARGVELALTGRHDLVIVDLMLPEQSGFEVIEILRARSSVPVLVLTALTELEDRLACFGLGADDFMTKPFWMEELVARVRARLRIREHQPNRQVAWANAVIDLDAREVRVDATVVSLTRIEFDLLAHLIVREGRAQTRRQLADAALPQDAYTAPRTLDSHVARLRKKLGPDAAQRVATVWGIGYQFESADAGDGES